MCDHIAFEKAEFGIFQRAGLFACVVHFSDQRDGHDVEAREHQRADQKAGEQWTLVALRDMCGDNALKKEEPEQHVH